LGSATRDAKVSVILADAEESFVTVPLLSGDVYYVKNGAVKGFGMANRVVAGILAVFFLFRVFNALTAN
jgi:hypothetical protein